MVFETVNTAVGLESRQQVPVYAEATITKDTIRYSGQKDLSPFTEKSRENRPRFSDKQKRLILADAVKFPGKYDITHLVAWTLGGSNGNDNLIAFDSKANQTTIRYLETFVKMEVLKPAVDKAVMKAVVERNRGESFARNLYYSVDFYRNGSGESYKQIRVKIPNRWQQPEKISRRKAAFGG